MSKRKSFYNETYEHEKIESLTFEYERNKYYPELFPILSKPHTIIDIGCESGTLCEWLKGRGYDPIGIDISETACKLTKSRGIDAYCINIDEYPIPFMDSSMDEVYMGDILEHIINVEFALSEAHRVLKDSGLLKFTVPNMGFMPLRIRYLLTGSIPATNPNRDEYRHDLPWRWEHIRFYNWFNIQQLLNSMEFKQVSLKGIAGKPFNKLSQIYSPAFAYSIIGVYEKV